MTNRIILIRTIGRFVIVLGLTAAIVLTLFLLVRELNDGEVNEALTALLGGGLVGLTNALNSSVQAIAANPSDRTASERE